MGCHSFEEFFTGGHRTLFFPVCMNFFGFCFYSNYNMHHLENTKRVPEMLGVQSFVTEIVMQMLVHVSKPRMTIKYCR